jgi:hypothetical protein
MTNLYDAKQNGIQSYDLCIDTLREKCIRDRSVKPLNEKETRWAQEGPKPFDEFETLNKPGRAA